MTPPVDRQPQAGRGLVHVFALATVATSSFMLLTANELGPFGPLVIAEAFYLLGFAATLEASILAMSAWRFVRNALKRRRAAASPTSSNRRGVLG